MQWLVEVGLSNALAAVVLAMVAWIVGRIWRRPAVTHALWLLVLLKLLTPPIFELPLPLSIVRTASFDPQVLTRPEGPGAVPPPRFGKAATNNVDARRERATIAPRALEHDRVFAAQAGADEYPSFNSAAEPQQSAAAENASTLSARIASTSASPSADRVAPRAAPMRESTDSMFPRHDVSWDRWGQLAAMVWLAGVMAWVALQVALGLRLRAMLRASAPVPVALSEAAQQIARRMGLRRCPQVRIVAGTGSPMLCGLGYRVSILIPEALLRRLGPEAQATVLAHELAHYGRGDQWVRLVELIVTGLYWWLPIVWWSRHQIEIAEEQCCDAHVVEMCGGKTRVYAEALLDIVDLISEPTQRMRPAMSSSIGHRPLLQKRLVDLMRRRCVPTMTPVTRRVILVAGAVCLLCHPSLFVNEAPTASAATADVRVPLLAASNDGVGIARVPLLAASSVTAENAADALKSLYVPPELIRLRGSTPSTAVQIEAAPEMPLDLPSPERAQSERSEWATAISPNGRYHITVRRGYECVLREVTRNHVRSLIGRRITCVAFAADSARFVTGDLEGTVRLWDAASGEVLQTLTQREGPVYSVCLAPSGDQAVAAGADGVVELVSLISPSDRHVLARLDAPVRCARFSPDGSRLGVATDTWSNTAAATVVVYDVVSRARLLQWEVTAPLGAVDFPAEDRIVTIEWSGRAREWTLPALYAVDLPAIAKELVSAASFSVDSRVLEDLGQHTADRF